MHFKLGLLAAVAASASAASSSADTIGQTHQLRHFEVENQICITEQAYTFCKDGFKPIYEQKQSMPMLCVDRNDPIVPSMEQIVSTGHRMRQLRDRATQRVMKVEKVIKCQPTRLTLTDSEPVEYENRNSWETTSAKRNTGTESNKYGSKYSVSNPEARREITEKLNELKSLVPNASNSIQLSKDEYEKAFELAKELNKYEQVQNNLRVLNKQLPAIFVQAVQHIQNPLIPQYDDMMYVNPESVKVLKELKELAYRVYVYTVVKLAEQAHQSTFDGPFDYSNVIQELENVWRTIHQSIPNQSSSRIEDWLRIQLPKIQQQLEEQVQYDDLSLPTTATTSTSTSGTGSIYPSIFGNNTNEKMTKQQKERLQVILEKILLGSIQLAKQVENGSEARRESGLFGKLFNNQSSHYKQLIQQSKNKFDFIQ